jgi:hypothetical protein
MALSSSAGRRLTLLCISGIVLVIWVGLVQADPLPSPLAGAAVFSGKSG